VRHVDDEAVLAKAVQGANADASVTSLAPGIAVVAQEKADVDSVLTAALREPPPAPTSGSRKDTTRVGRAIEIACGPSANRDEPERSVGQNTETRESLIKNYM
jgi:hypothetical protein